MSLLSDKNGAVAQNSNLSIIFIEKVMSMAKIMRIIQSSKKKKLLVAVRIKII